MMELMRLACHDEYHECLEQSWNAVNTAALKIHLSLERKYEYELFKFMRDNRLTKICVVKKLKCNSGVGLYELFYKFYKMDEMPEAQKDACNLMTQIERLDFSRAARMSDEEFEINCRPMISKGSNVEIVREWRNAVRG